MPTTELKNTADAQSCSMDGLGDAVTFDSFFDAMERLADERDPIGAQVWAQQV